MFRLREDRSGHWMFEVGFDGGGQSEQTCLIAVNGSDDGQAMTAFRQGSSLIEEDNVDVSHALQGEPVLDQDPVAGSHPGRDGDHERYC